MLQQNLNLKKLDLSNNQFGDSVGNIIADAFKVSEKFVLNISILTVFEYFNLGVLFCINLKIYLNKRNIFNFFVLYIRANGTGNLTLKKII